MDLLADIYVDFGFCKGVFLEMKSLMVTYELRGQLVRAMLNLSSEEEIIPILMQYHMEANDEVIHIKNVREYHENQRVLHVWYCD